MNVNDLIAIDTHTHAEVSCRQPADAFWLPFEQASAKYFKSGRRPTIAETIDYYRERKIGLVMFTVDSEFEIGNRRISNDEVAEAAAANSDIMIAFASIDPHKKGSNCGRARLATFDSPTELPAGVCHVWVAGEAIVADGRITGRRPGRVL